MPGDFFAFITPPQDRFPGESSIYIRTEACFLALPNRGAGCSGVEVNNHWFEVVERNMGNIFPEIRIGEALAHSGLAVYPPF